MSPTGSDSNAGTQAAPFLTIQHAHGAITAGGTIWVMPGTYRYDRTVNLSLTGSANNVTRLWAVRRRRAPGDRLLAASARHVEQARPQHHRQLLACRGFEIKNANDNCIAISGSHNTIE